MYKQLNQEGQNLDLILKNKLVIQVKEISKKKCNKKKYHMQGFNNILNQSGFS